MSEERDQEQYAAYLAEQDAHEEALAQRAAEEEFEQQLAAAHRAGAIEALDWLISQYQQQIGVIKQHREYYAAVGSVEYVNVMNQELSGLRNARWTAIVAKSRYAEPEVMNDNPDLPKDYCEKLKKAYENDKESYRAHIFGEWDVRPPEPEEEKKP